MAPGGSGKGSRQRQQKQQQQQEEQQQQQVVEQRALGEPRSTGASGSEEAESQGFSRKGGGAGAAAPLFSIENLQANVKAVNYGRSFMSIIAGVVAGVLGLTGLAGFLCYAAVMVLCSLAFLFKSGFNTKTYFDNPNRVTLDGFSAGAMSFILFWTLAYDIVHIF